nr:hypothetical protein Iba_chr01eCG7620 [Ipomoea batatas]
MTLTADVFELELNKLRISEEKTNRDLKSMREMSDSMWAERNKKKLEKRDKKLREVGKDPVLQHYRKLNKNLDEACKKAEESKKKRDKKQEEYDKNVEELWKEQEENGKKLEEHGKKLEEIRKKLEDIYREMFKSELKASGGAEKHMN